jgi:hypothetical protein
MMSPNSPRKRCQIVDIVLDLFHMGAGDRIDGGAIPVLLIG